MVLRPPGSAHISLTHVAHKRRAATHPADPHTPFQANANREKLTRPGLTNGSPYQASAAQLLTARSVSTRTRERGDSRAAGDWTSPFIGQAAPGRTTASS